MGPKGADGKSLTFDQLTDEQKAELTGPEGPIPTAEEIAASLRLADDALADSDAIVTSDLLYRSLVKAIDVQTITESTEISPPLNSETHYAALVANGDDAEAAVLTVNLSDVARPGDEIRVALVASNPTAEVSSPLPLVNMTVVGGDILTLGDTIPDGGAFGVDMTAKRLNGYWEVTTRIIDKPDGWAGDNPTTDGIKVVFSNAGHPSIAAAYETTVKKSGDSTGESLTLSAPTGFAKLLNTAPLAGWKTSTGGTQWKAAGATATYAELAAAATDGTVTLYPIYTPTNRTLLKAQTKTASGASGATSWAETNFSEIAVGAEPNLPLEISASVTPANSCTMRLLYAVGSGSYANVIAAQGMTAKQTYKGSVTRSDLAAGATIKCKVGVKRKNDNAVSGTGTVTITQTVK